MPNFVSVHQVDDEMFNKVSDNFDLLKENIRDYPKSVASSYVCTKFHVNPSITVEMFQSKQ